MTTALAFDPPGKVPRLAPRVLETIRRFTPNWFTATMGTGIVALAVNQFPLPVPGLHAIGQALWLTNILLFALFSGLYAARWVLFPGEARRIFGHSVMSMFFGAIPMGLATILNGFLVFGLPLWGQDAVEIARALWWIDAAMALLCGVAVPFLMFTRQDHSIEKMTAVWLLPVVAAEVTAASGGLLAPYLADADSFRTVMLSYVLWAFSVPVALGILVILLLRLIVHKLPPRDMAASGWLALGPIGTGALGLLLLGADAPHACAVAGLPEIGQVAAGIGVIGGTILWGYGLWWLALAVLMTVRYLRQGMPFNLGWWASPSRSAFMPSQRWRWPAPPIWISCSPSAAGSSPAWSDSGSWWRRVPCTAPGSALCSRHPAWSEARSRRITNPMRFKTSTSPHARRRAGRRSWTRRS